MCPCIIYRVDVSVLFDNFFYFLPRKKFIYYIMCIYSYLFHKLLFNYWYMYICFCPCAYVYMYVCMRAFFFFFFLFSLIDRKISFAFIYSVGLEDYIWVACKASILCTGGGGWRRRVKKWANHKKKKKKYEVCMLCLILFPLTEI